MSEPDSIWWNGTIVPWESAMVHVTSETALRGLNIFEGLRAYWRPAEEGFAIVAPHWHLDRLEESARLMQIPARGARDRLVEGLRSLLSHIADPSDLYLRPTIYIESGGYELDPRKVVVGEFISWKRAEKRPDRSLRCAISSWTHIPAISLPAAAKIGARYTAFRLARLEAASKSFDEAILLNQAGEITETPGGSVFAVSRGLVSTPPLSTGILPSITRRIVLEELCPRLGLRTLERTLRPSDLRSAEEVFVAGTLDEISRVTSVDDHLLPEPNAAGPLQQIASLFRSECQGATAPGSPWLHLYPGNV